MKNTISTTYRGDIRKLATIALFQSETRAFSSVNSLVNSAIEMLTHMIIDKSPKFEVTEYSKAVEILEQLGIYSHDSSKNRSMRNLVNELSLESAGSNLEDIKKVLGKKSDNSAFGSDQKLQEMEGKLKEEMENLGGIAKPIKQED